MKNRYEVGDEVMDGLIVDEICHGGMATVYLTSNKASNHEMAFKSFDPEAATLRSDRFEEEAAIWAALPQNPFVVSVFGYFRRVHPLIAIERVSGGSLRKYLRAKSRNETQSLRLVAQVASGLRFLHKQGVVHGDLKPENVLLTSEGDAKITDFGLAQLVARGIHGGGTPPYMAPELHRGAPCSEAADCYALGLIYFELVRGLRPSQAIAIAETAATTLASVDDTLKSLFVRTVSAEAHERPRIEELATGLAVAAGMDLDESEADLEVSSLLNRGSTLSRLGRNGEAVALLEMALKQGETPLVGDPPGDVVRTNLATALRRSGNPKRAVRLAKEAHERCPEDRNALITLTNCYFELGDEPSGERCLARLAQLNPEDLMVLFVRLQWATKQGDARGAIQVAREGIRVSAREPEVLVTWARELEEFGLREEAMAALERGCQLYPDKDCWLTNLAILKERSRGLAHVHDAYVTAVSATPRSAFAHFLLSRSLLQQGMMPEALQASERCQELAPAAPFTGTIVPIVQVVAGLNPDERPPWVRELLRKVFDSSFVFWRA